MKRILILLFTITTLSGFGQGFPFYATKPITSKVYSIEDRAKYEGLVFFNNAATLPSNYSLNTGATDANTPAVNGVLPSISNYSWNVFANLSKNVYVKSASIWCSADMTYTISLGSHSIGGVVGTQAQNILIEDVLRPKENLVFTPQGSVSPVYSGTTVNNRYVARSSFLAYHMSADVDFSAPYSAYFIGDSNMEGTAILNPTSSISSSTLGPDVMWHWQVRKWYRANRSQVRIIEKSLAGSTSSSFESRRQKGELRLLEPPTIIYYVLGTNDSDATVLGANITTFINWALAEWPADATTNYPGVKIVIVGQIPKQGGETQATLNRTAASNAVTAVNNARVIYINGGAAFNVNDNTQYSGTEAAGSGVHMSITGQTSLANYIISQLQSHDATSNVKFATFNSVAEWQMWVNLLLLLVIVYRRRSRVLKNKQMSTLY